MATPENKSLQSYISVTNSLLVRRLIQRVISFHISTKYPTGKRPLGRSARRWEDNIRKDLEEIGINAGNWVDSA